MSNKEKQTKSNVVRLSDAEYNLIKAVREVGLADFLAEVKVKGWECDKIRRVLLRMRDNQIKPVDMESYFNSGCFSYVQYAGLLDAVENGDSIIITGCHGSGKSTLLRSLLELESFKDKKIGVFEEVQELFIDQDYESRKIVPYRDGKAINLEDVKNLETGVLVINDLITPAACLSLLNSLSVGKRVLATDFRTGNWKAAFLSQYDTADAAFKAFAERTLNISNIFVVELGFKENGQRTCMRMRKL